MQSPGKGTCKSACRNQSQKLLDLGKPEVNFSIARLQASCWRRRPGENGHCPRRPTVNALSALIPTIR